MLDRPLASAEPVSWRTLGRKTKNGACVRPTRQETALLERKSLCDSGFCLRISWRPARQETRQEFIRGTSGSSRYQHRYPRGSPPLLPRAEEARPTTGSEDPNNDGPGKKMLFFS